MWDYIDLIIALPLIVASIALLWWHVGREPEREDSLLMEIDPDV